MTQENIDTEPDSTTQSTTTAWDALAEYQQAPLDVLGDAAMTQLGVRVTDEMVNLTAGMQREVWGRGVTGEQTVYFLVRRSSGAIDNGALLGVHERPVRDSETGDEAIVPCALVGFVDKSGSQTVRSEPIDALVSSQAVLAAQREAGTSQSDNNPWSIGNFAPPAQEKDDSRERGGLVNSGVTPVDRPGPMAVRQASMQPGSGIRAHGNGIYSRE